MRMIPEAFFMLEIHLILFYGGSLAIKCYSDLDERSSFECSYGGKFILAVQSRKKRYMILNALPIYRNRLIFSEKYLVQKGLLDQ